MTSIANFVNRQAALRVAVLASAATLAVPAMAQEQPAELPASETQYSGQEIIVTARMRAETALDVPISIATFDAEDLRRYATADLGKVAEMSPQLFVSKVASGAGATFTIRGIGSPPLDSGVEQSVSVNMDGVQISRGRIITQALFDLQQVEVLKGPQALFFGKNSPAGVISVTSAQPTEALSGYVTAGYEFRAHERFVEGAIGGPLTETLGARVALRASHNRGWIRNDAAPIANPLAPGFPGQGAFNRYAEVRDIAGRGTLVWKPSADFSANFKFLIGRSEDNGESALSENYCRGATTVPQTVSGADPQADCQLDWRRAVNAPNTQLTASMPYSNGGVPRSLQNNLLTSLTLRYHTGGLNLTSVTGLYASRLLSAESYTHSAFGNNLSTNREKSRNFTQEFRISSDFRDSQFNFTAGAFYENSKRDDYFSVFLPYAGPDPVTGRNHASERYGYNRGETISVFGELRFDLTDQIQLTGGARWTREEKSARVANTFVHPAYAGTFLTEGLELSPSAVDRNISPEVTARWKPNASTTLYAAYKTGYKSGGFANPSLFTANYNEDLLGFDSESAEGFEAGYKGELINRTLRVDLTAYSYTFDNLQLTVFSPPFSFVVNNAAKARTSGADATLNWDVVEGLSLRGSVGYNRAKFLSYPGGKCWLGQTPAQGCVGGVQDLSGKPLTRAPRWVGTTGFTYEMPVASSIKVGFNGDAFYSTRYFTQESLDPLATQEAFWRFNAGVSIADADDVWRIALIGRNLTDKYYVIYSNDKPFGSPGEFVAYGTRPREIMLQGTFRF